jgi:hypothetical protein
MPRHDIPNPGQKLGKVSAIRVPRDLVVYFLQLGKKRRRPPERGGGTLPEPVEPPRPRPLSGGAAAELEFDG